MRVTDIAPDNAEYFEDLVPEWGFENENLFWLGAIAGDGTACAVLGVGICDEAAYIDWIYTEPSCRRKGAARDLLKMLKTMLRKIEVKILTISVFDDNEDLEEFLEAEGFFFDGDTGVYSVPFRDLIYSELLDTTWKKYRTGSRVVTLKDFGKYDKFCDYLQADGIPIGTNLMDARSSLIRLDEDGRISGCMLLYRRKDGDMEIAYLKSDGLTEGAIDIFLALKDLAMNMDLSEERLIFSDRSGTIIKSIEELTGKERDTYIVAGKKSGMITLA